MQPVTRPSSVGCPLLVESSIVISSIWMYTTETEGLLMQRNEGFISPSSVTPTSKYPLLAFSVENFITLPSMSTHSSMHGIGYDSWICSAFNLHWSTEKRRVTSFLGTETVVEGNSAWPGSITSMASIPNISCFSSFLALDLGRWSLSVLVCFPSSWVWFRASLPELNVFVCPTCCQNVWAQ